MASNSAKLIALLPIQPRFAQLIMIGKKKVEFRKVSFRKEVSHCLVYASSPIQKIIGYFELSYIDKDFPKKLWTRYKAVGGIPYEEFQTYYACTVQGVAIGIGKVYALRNPVSLKSLSKSLVAPQNFIYLTPDSIKPFTSLVKFGSRI